MAGRPKAKINWSFVDKKLRKQCSGVGIAHALGIDYSTLQNRCLEEHKMNFSEYSQQKKALGLDDLREKIWDGAQNGNVTLIIWASKQYLGMREPKNIPDATDTAEFEVTTHDA